jgi:hypothetical protein
LTANAGFALVAVLISIIDAPIDVAFIINIAPGPAGENHEIIGDFYAAFSTLMLAVAANFLILCHFLKTEASSNPAFSPWLWNHRSYAVPVLFLAMFKFDCMALLYSGFLQMPAFSAPLSIKSQQRLVWLGVVGTLLEGFPQIMITIDVHQHQEQGHFSFLVLATLVLNSCSLLYALLTRLVAGIVYGSHHPDKKQRGRRSTCSRISSAVPDIVLLIVMLAGAAVVVFLLHHHDPSPHPGPHPSPSQSQCSGRSVALAVSECKAMGQLHDELHGQSWDQCEHTKFTPCDCASTNSQSRIVCEHGHVTAIELPHNGLYGSLPGTILSALPHLTSLKLDGNNNLFGTIPSGISTLTKLLDLNLSATSLAGSISPLSALVQLTSLDLGASLASDCTSKPQGTTIHFSGNTSMLSPLVELRSLDIHGGDCGLGLEIYDVNNITGSMADFSGLTKLTSLNLEQGGCNTGPWPLGNVCSEIIGGSISGEHIHI